MTPAGHFANVAVAARVAQQVGGFAADQIAPRAADIDSSKEAVAKEGPVLGSTVSASVKFQAMRAKASSSGEVSRA